MNECRALTVLQLLVHYFHFFLCLFVFSLPEDHGVHQNPRFWALYMHEMETQPKDSIKDSRNSEWGRWVKADKVSALLPLPFEILSFCVLLQFQVQDLHIIFSLPMPRLFQEGRYLFIWEEKSCLEWFPA